MEEDVSKFLNEFKTKLEIWGVLFRDDRGKNFQSLADLEITPSNRMDILKNLQLEDYSEGPLEEKLNGGEDMWVFGRIIKSKEVYIKISYGRLGTSVICISFHIAEYKMEYPLKKIL
ncbi:hypothetical protein [Chryseobacterium fistulae]|uniref:Toxin n=1 Tax=Chryseobacterium fistulae TaxID=2675058 RepID=A0A6N4XPM9_9FLAO|nr:hypothetical protein [Chryseobacterium fistulae]CAA7389329.1 hypothetical protein CHRY9393_02119 [Chryseobacterium fistulae]